MSRREAIGLCWHLAVEVGGDSLQRRSRGLGNGFVLLSTRCGKKAPIAEELRAKHKLQGMVKEFSVDDYECFVLWKGPGYSADIIIDREKNEYTGEVANRSWMAVLDDLHKGRDCGPVWSWVIDVSAVLLTVLSITGIWLLFYLKKRRRSGLIVGLVGCVLVVVSYAFGVH